MIDKQTREAVGRAVYRHFLRLNTADALTCVIVVPAILAGSIAFLRLLIEVIWPLLGVIVAGVAALYAAIALATIAVKTHNRTLYRNSRNRNSRNRNGRKNARVVK